MIKKHSDDPDVAQAADQALQIVTEVLAQLPKAESFDYGGHQLRLGEYDVCAACTSPIAEAQQASQALRTRADSLDDPVVKEHVELAAQLFQLDAEAAIIRADFHNGQGTEVILNAILGYEYQRKLHDEFQHSHHQGN